MSTPKRKKSRRGPTRTYATTFSDHSGFLAVVIGDYPEVETTMVIWYQNTIALYDGDDFKFGNTTPMKIQWVDKNPKIFFDALCRLTDFKDQDNLRDYIQDTQKDYELSIQSQLRQRQFEIGNMLEFSSTILEKLRAEVEDYMECSGTPWRKVRTWVKRHLMPGDELPKKPKDKKPKKAKEETKAASSKKGEKKK